MLADAGIDQHALDNGRPTIAVLIGSMASAYQEGILRGAAHVAEEKDYNILGFCDGDMNSKEIRTPDQEKVFELVNMDLIAGVIGPFSSHTRFLNKSESEKFITRFASVPIVNIGSSMQGCANIVTDYSAGFKELFKHFEQNHHYQNIILVRGPKHHSSSNQRMEIYQSLIEKYGLPCHDEMIIYTDLNGAAAKATMLPILQNKEMPIDAIIALNDSQALGIIEACQELGIRVPEDIAVVGSMNTLIGAFATPALTSIQEPLFELGRTAAIELINQIEGKAVTHEIHIPTSLVIRESCGCQTSHQDDLPEPVHNIGETPLNKHNDPIFNEAEKELALLVAQHRGGVIKQDVQNLLNQYHRAIYQKDFQTFLDNLKNKLQDSIKTEDIMLWLAFTAKLEMTTLQYLELAKDSHDLIVFIRQLVNLKNKTEQTTIKFQRFETDYYLEHFRNIVNDLNSSFDLTTIKKYAVGILELSELYISVYHNAPNSPLLARNIIATRHTEFIELEKHDFKANHLIPPDVKNYKDRFSLMIFTLSFGKKSIGFMAFNLSDRKGTAFENLRAIISSALKNEQLIENLKDAEERFSDIAHSTSNWLWETNEKNQFTYSSESSKEVIGHFPHELLQQKICQLAVNSCDAFIERMASHEDIVNIECWCNHKNGKVICLMISAKPIIKEGEFKGYRGIFEDITEQKLQEEKIKNLAYSDVLTGLANRTLFQDKLEQTIKRSAKTNSKFALMFIDLDRFKYINDSMGHASGDLLLVELATRLTNSIRSRDLLARLGGDEFVIILNNIAHEEEVIFIAERIFKNTQQPIMLNDKSIYCTLSLGISLFPNDATTSESLLQKGDSAMYQAKSQGRNCFVFYDKVLEKQNTLRSMYEEILHDAIATEKFILHYQPQVSIDSGKIVGFETLVRIENSKQGIISPNNFIPLAEDLGLIGQIDEWVFENSCKQYAAWHDAGLTGVRLSINLSAIQLRNDKVLDTYITIIEKYRVNPRDLQIEITENALIENEQTALNILRGFKDYGLSIALDDFGTGYSSLSCINLYPINSIKIDRSFVIDATVNPKNKAIILGTVVIASNLNLKIIAEGVETIEQYNLIKKLGCDEIQGYYFYKPCAASHATTLLQKQNSATEQLPEIEEWMRSNSQDHSAFN